MSRTDSAPAAPAFAGKFRWQSTNAAGARFFLAYTTAGDETAPTMSAARSTDPGTVWTAYDTGRSDGTVFVVSDAGLYLHVQDGIDTAILVPAAAAASALTLVADPASGLARIMFGELEACYQLGTGTPAVLVFQDVAESGDTFAQTDVTPSLATIRSTKKATGADLTNVNLTGADLTGVDATGAAFDGATLTGAKLAGATLTSVSFVGVDLTRASWGDNLNAAGAHFDATTATGLAFPSAGGKRTMLDHATFAGADWSGCDLTGASLKYATLTGTNFSGATLANATLFGLQGGRSNDGTVPGVDLSYAYLPDANLQSANLVGATLARAQMYVISTGVSLLQADLTETDFSGADLTGAQFGGRGAAIAGTRFDGAILFQATFTGTALKASTGGLPVSMVGARLESATFSQVTFTGVQLSGAHVAVAIPVAGSGGAGVPLFVITSGVPDAVATLQGGHLPADFLGADGPFATAGCVLSSGATVAVTTAGTCWMLQQNATLAQPGVEDVGYTVALVGGVLEVSASRISVVEQGDDESSSAAPYTVGATGLTQAALSPDTRCPNRATVAVNVRRGLTWAQMMTAPRPSLASFDSVAAGGSRPRHAREHRVRA